MKKVRTKEFVRQVLTLRMEGESVQMIAEKLKCSRYTVHRVLKNGFEPPEIPESVLRSAGLPAKTG